MGMEQSGAESKGDLKEQSENIQHRFFFFPMKFFKVILNFTWETKELKTAKNNFGELPY